MFICLCLSLCKFTLYIQRFYAEIHTMHKYQALTGNLSLNKTHSHTHTPNHTHTSLYFYLSEDSYIIHIIPTLTQTVPTNPPTPHKP